MDPFIGMIVQFGGNFAPRGWALCDGQLLPISDNTNDNSALFSILGTAYGGDGRTTFGLPDLRGRAAKHAGNGPGLSNYSLGQKGGRESVMLTQNELPSHTHACQVNADNGLGNKSSPNNKVWAADDTAERIYSNNPTTDAVMRSDAVVAEPTGNSQPFEIMGPYQCVNFIIALQGIYPSRN